MPKSRLEESLEEDMKAAGITQAEMDAFERDVNDHEPLGDIDDEEDASAGSNEDEEPDTKSARERLEARRAGRKSSDDEGEPSQDASGKPRGPDGSASDTGEGTPQDGETLPDAVDTSPAGMARIRRELREAKAKITELSTPKIVEQAREAVAPVTPPVPSSSAVANAKAERRTLEQLGPEPDENEDLAGNLIWNRERNKIVLEEIQAERTKERANGLFTAALQEVDEIGSAYSKVQPDYSKAIEHAEREYARAIKMMMPHTTDAQVAAALKKEKINLAIKCEQEGTNVAEVLYDLAIERFGYNPDAGSNESAPTPAIPTKPALVKPNLSTVAKNQRRSASPLDGGGQSGRPRITLEQASMMSPLELMNLPQEDITYLEAMGL